MHTNPSLTLGIFIVLTFVGIILGAASLNELEWSGLSKTSVVLLVVGIVGLILIGYGIL